MKTVDHAAFKLEKTKFVFPQFFKTRGNTEQDGLAFYRTMFSTNKHLCCALWNWLTQESGPAANISFFVLSRL